MKTIFFLCASGIGFPNGTAPTARVTAYARGLVGVKSRVCLVCLGPSEVTEVGILNTETAGNHDGIEFEYACGTTLRGKTFLSRRWLALKGPLVAAWHILRRSRRGGIEALFLYGDTLATSLWFWLIARLCGAVYVVEKSERPFLQAERSLSWKLYGYAYVRTIFKLFDGAVVISEYLRDYMKSHMRKRASLLQVPILVDVEQFVKPTGQAVFSGRYVAYSGMLNERKDGVLTLLRAFASISDEFPDVSLVLIGDSYQHSQIPAFRAAAQELGIGGRTLFAGLVPRDQLPSYLCRAEVLVLARPSSKQAEAGFPTKVGEYLATGRPVIVTRTGELDRYLEDDISVYFSPPDDCAAFAARLRHVLSHPEEAQAVGDRGREVARLCFDYRVNAAALKRFIDELALRRTGTREAR